MSGASASWRCPACHSDTHDAKECTGAPTPMTINLPPTPINMNALLDDAAATVVAGGVHINLAELSQEITATATELMDADKQDMVRNELRESQNRSANVAHRTTRDRAAAANAAGTAIRPNLGTTMGMAQGMNNRLGLLTKQVKSKKTGAVKRGGKGVPQPTNTKPRGCADLCEARHLPAINANHMVWACKGCKRPFRKTIGKNNMSHCDGGAACPAKVTGL